MPFVLRPDQPAFPRILAALSCFLFLGSSAGASGGGDHDLVMKGLAGTWDEAIPLGNGWLGALVWEKSGRLRISLDRADLWDLRPMKNLDSPEWTFAWVISQWKKGDYKTVQDMFDVPYDAEPAPSKIPAAAIEFDQAGLGPVRSVRLFIREALCRVEWTGGAVLETFVQAERNAGLFRWTGPFPEPALATPPYGRGRAGGSLDPVTGQDLRRLGYAQGRVARAPGSLVYEQEGWGGFRYQVAVAWRRGDDGRLEGAWSVTSSASDKAGSPQARSVVREALAQGFDRAFKEHADWWKRFWSRSSLSLPDKLLERQWFLEQYKFGSAARRGAPPISLQAVWTADNGQLPPWKGDFHHDLNTELSYWPCYAADHLEEGLGFLDWLWSLRPRFEEYTRAFFGTPGLNVPGVTTLDGRPMGGWIQYSFSPTCAAWLGHHFYLHWRYSQDREFLAGRAYPWIRDVAVHLRALAVKDERGLKRLPLSSSPEVLDNRREAWFAAPTNYDLALIKWTFAAAAELASELGLPSEAREWILAGEGWPDFAVDPAEGLMFAPGFPYHESHRHFSHQLAYHPLGLIDMSRGEGDRKVIRATLENLDRRGTDGWCGYSFAWLAGLRARAFDGRGAAEALRTFATCFCLPNSFHANGDQSGTGKSKMTYRPFTLEGNFAFASGLQEMLLQSHAGVVRVFPAVPDEWRDASFDRFRAEGAFLVSARKAKGEVEEVEVLSEKGGRLRLANPFRGPVSLDGRPFPGAGETLEVETRPGQVLVFGKG